MEGTDPRGRDKGSLVLTLELIDDYLQFMKARGCSKNTLLSYRRGLLDFYDWLPEGKLINDNTAWEYQITLVSRYKPRSVNMKMVSINGFFSYVRRRDYQVTARVPVGQEDDHPELSRGEYLQLLHAAKRRGNERLYLLIKVFSTTGIAVNEIPRLTVEAVKSGVVRTFVKRNPKDLRIPSCVQEALLSYARRNEILSGQLFLTRNGCSIARSAISGMILRLSGEAGVDQEKCNPRCLQRLFEKTQESLKASVSQLVQAAYDNLLRSEQTTYGWEDASKRSGL